MWLKLDDHFHDHPKVIAAGNAAIGLWVRCANYSGAYDLDGFIPRAAMLAMSEHPTQQGRCSKVGMWVPSEGGVLIPSFLEYNPSGAENRARRERDAQRKRDARARALERQGRLFDDE